MASTNVPSSQKIRVSLPSLAKMIDHSLLHPTMTTTEIQEGLMISRDYNVAAACVKPYSVVPATDALEGTDVKICAVIGFPHGNSTSRIKVAEAREAVQDGAHEIDMVVNIGLVKGGHSWDYIEEEIQEVNDVVTQGHALLKVIFENDYLSDAEIVKLCEICTKIGVAFVKTSTGYGFVKQSNGMYSYAGATTAHLKLMKEHCGKAVQIKAAGGVRTLDDLLRVKALGVTRVGATATIGMLEEAKNRGIGNEEVEIDVP